MKSELVARRLGNVPGLTGLRAIAIGLVVLLHADPAMKGGWIGVEVFFVLSGFLITSLLLSEQSRMGSFSIPRFYLRRIFRLVPAFWVFLGLVGVWAAIWRSHTFGSWRHDIFERATYQMDFYQVAHVANDGIGLTWTLAVEEQFYLLWPLVLGIGLRLPRRAFISLIAVGAVVSLGAAVVMGQHGVTYRRLYFGADTNAMPLLIGCLAAFFFTGGGLDRFAASRATTWIPIATFGVLMAMLVTISNLHDWVFEGPTFIVSVLVAGTILSLALNPTTLVSRTLAHPIVVWVGVLSYSLYLWNEWALLATAHIGHGLFNKVAHATIGLAVTFALAIASYYLIEKPGLRLKARFEVARKGDRVADNSPSVAVKA